MSNCISLSCSTVSNLMNYSCFYFFVLENFFIARLGFDRASLDQNSVVFTTTPSQPDLKGICFWGYLSQFYYRKKLKKKEHIKLKYLYLRNTESFKSYLIIIKRFQLGLSFIGRITLEKIDFEKRPEKKEQRG